MRIGRIYKNRDEVRAIGKKIKQLKEQRTVPRAGHSVCLVYPALTIAEARGEQYRARQGQSQAFPELNQERVSQRTIQKRVLPGRGGQRQSNLRKLTFMKADA